MLDLSLFETYETPDDVILSPKRFLLGRRLALYSDFVNIILKSRKFSKKGIFTDSLFWEASDNIREVMERYGGRFHIEGLQNLNTTGPFVFVSNHMSILETQLMPWVIGCFSPVSMVMKDSLYDSRFFGPIAQATKSIALTRKDLKADLDTIMTEGVAFLKKRRSIMLFPEGTRKEYFNRNEFNSLGVKLAARAGVKVVPIAVKTDFMEPGKVVPDFCSIHPDREIMISIGQPLVIEGRGKQEHQKNLDFIEQKLRAWGYPIR